MDPPGFPNFPLASDQDDPPSPPSRLRQAAAAPPHHNDSDAPPSSPASSGLSSAPPSPNHSLLLYDPEDPTEDQDGDSQSTDSESESDDEHVPAGSKRKAGPKGKTSGTRKKGRGKAGKKEVKAKGQGIDNAVKRIKKEVDADGKPVLRAKVARWGDIPDWGDSLDCPLLKLPEEVLDKCFGIHQDLEVRDWVALAATNSYFRHNLNDEFFHEVWYLRCTKKGRSAPRSIIIAHEDGHEVSSRPNRPQGHPARRPFTRQIESWWSTPLVGTSEAVMTPNAFYTPRGHRESWSREQYTVYKEEKARFRHRERKRRIKQNEEAAKKAEQTRLRSGIPVGTLRRKIYAIVSGRRDGRRAIKKDAKGLPLVKIRGAGEEDDGLRKTMLLRAQAGFKVSDEAADMWENAKTPKWQRDCNADSWSVPDTDSEDEVEADELKVYDSLGNEIVKDNWQSTWRKHCAKEVKEAYINQTDAIAKYKVTRAELITLRHYLVSNPLSSRHPQLVFHLEAVKMLAYRSHGGVKGHKAFMEVCAAKSAKITEARDARMKEAKAAGTWVEPEEKCRNPFAHRQQKAYGGILSDWCDCNVCYIPWWG